MTHGRLGTYKGHALLEGPKGGIFYHANGRKRYVPKKHKKTISWNFKKSKHQVAQARWQGKAYGKYYKKLKTATPTQKRAYVTRVNALSTISPQAKALFRKKAGLR